MRSRWAADLRCCQLSFAAKGCGLLEDFRGRGEGEFLLEAREGLMEGKIKTQLGEPNNVAAPPTTVAEDQVFRRVLDRQCPVHLKRCLNVIVLASGGSDSTPRLLKTHPLENRRWKYTVIPYVGC